MTANEFYPLSGRTVQLDSADHQAILLACAGHYKVEYKPGLALILSPDNSVPWRYPYWFVSFNEGDGVHPGDWFHEASSNLGHVYNRNLLGPRACDMFIELLREGIN